MDPALQPVPVYNFWQHSFQDLCIIIWFFLIVVVSSTSYFVIIYLLLFSSYKIIPWCVIFPYLIWIWYIDYHTPDVGGRPSTWVRNWTFWRGYCDYFPIKIVKTCELNPQRNYLMACHPHGIFCMGFVGCFGSDAVKVKETFPGFDFRIFTVPFNFRFPIFRDIFLGMGMCSASKKSMNYVLSKPGGGMIGLVTPGAIPESLRSHAGSVIINILNRKGFVKVAIQNRAWLVPVFVFGEIEIFDQVPNPKGSWVRNIQELFMKTVKFCPTIPKGPGIFGILPRRLPVTLVVGKPIQVDKVEQPSTELISEVHLKFMDGLVDLYYDNKGKYAVDPYNVIGLV